MPVLGAHVSAAGGAQNAPGRGRDINAEAIQIFTANQNQWKPKPLNSENIDGFRAGMAEGKPSVSITHDSYLINLCSVEDWKLQRARDTFVEEMDRSETLGIDYIVFHPGAHMDQGYDKGCEIVAESLNLVLAERPDYKVKLLVEITAGQGTTVGCNFEQIAQILEPLKEPDRVGVCFDTQHAFASGYDLRTPDGWNDTMQKFDELIGLDRLNAFHLNDSKKEHGNRVDRHEKLGKGFIGLSPFWAFMNDDRFANTAAVLETPVDDPSEYAEEIELLKGLAGAPEPEPVVSE